MGRRERRRGCRRRGGRLRKLGIGGCGDLDSGEQGVQGALLDHGGGVGLRGFEVAVGLELESARIGGAQAIELVRARLTGGGLGDGNDGGRGRVENVGGTMVGD